MTKQLDNLDLNNTSRIVNSPDPLVDSDLANKGYVDTEILSKSPLQETGTNGFVVKKNDTEFEIRTLTAGSNKVSISNGNGVSADPSIDVNESNLALSNISGTLGIAKGGTGQTTANDALNALLPSQISANGKYLKSDGSNASWDSVIPNVTALQLNRVSKVYIDSPYTALTTDYFIDCDATSGAITINLYTAVGNTGRELVISKIDSSTNTITIDPNASETIAGLSTIVLRTQYESITIKSNGTNWDIVSSNLGSLTTSAGAYLPVFGCRAWVNFDGTTAANVSGTYSQSGTTVTVTITGHGHKVGHVIYSDITSGSGVDGVYTVASVINANTFTYTAGSSLTTSGNITLNRRAIRASGNVSNISYLSTGDYAVNLINALPDINYVTHVTPGSGSTTDAWCPQTRSDLSSTISNRVYLKGTNVAFFNIVNMNVSIFR